VLPAVIIGAFLFMKRDLREVLTMPLLGMSFAFLAIALPWYVMMYVVHGKEFIDVFIGFHNIVRFLEPEHKTGAVFYYYVPVLFGGLFPWSPFLPFGIWESFKKASTDKTWGGSSHAFLLVWFLVFFVFFSLASTRLPTYIFPSFAPLALMIGNLWDEALEVEGRGRRVATWMRISHHLLFGSLMAGIIGLYIFLGIRYPELMWGAIFAGTLLAVGISLSFMSSEKKRFLASFLFIVLAVASFLPPLSYAVLPEIERHETSKGIAEKLEGLMKQDERIGCESDYLPGLAFYTGKTPVNIDRHHDLVTFLGSSDRVWCVLKEKNHIELYTLDSKPYYTKPSYVVWRHGKKCIVTNKVPDDGRYLQKRERVR
jgi:4-amino-4-deoxy-L-arabinose transferase-like glycosyltransferase